jgi:hypothetical protein
LPQICKLPPASISAFVSFLSSVAVFARLGPIVVDQAD